MLLLLPLENLPVGHVTITSFFYWSALSKLPLLLVSQGRCLPTISEVESYLTATNQFVPLSVTRLRDIYLLGDRCHNAGRPFKCGHGTGKLLP